MNLSNDEKLVSIARVTEEDVAEGGDRVTQASPIPRPIGDGERDGGGGLDEDGPGLHDADPDGEVDDADLDTALDEEDDATPGSDPEDE
jgi:hypothetical protein